MENIKNEKFYFLLIKTNPKYENTEIQSSSSNYSIRNWILVLKRHDKLTIKWGDL